MRNFIISTLAVLAFSLAAFQAGAALSEYRISKSCDDKAQEQTTIAGHIYFCDDYTHARGMINYLIQQAQKRGV